MFAPQRDDEDVKPGRFRKPAIPGSGLESQEIQRRFVTGLLDDLLGSKAADQRRVRRKPLLSDLPKLAGGYEKVLAHHVREEDPFAHPEKAER